MRFPPVFGNFADTVSGQWMVLTGAYRSLKLASSPSLLLVLKLSQRKSQVVTCRVEWEDSGRLHKVQKYFILEASRSANLRQGHGILCLWNGVESYAYNNFFFKSRITTKMLPLFVISNNSTNFHQNPFKAFFLVIMLTDKQTNTSENTTSLAEVTKPHRHSDRDKQKDRHTWWQENT